MENSPTPISQSPQMHPSVPPPKKGLGIGAKIGIGCGAVVALIILGIIIFTMIFGGRIKQFAEEAQKNPTRAAATMMVTAGGGKLEIVAEDDANKRYTVKEKATGTLTTIYWSDKKQAPEVVNGDFFAIPAPAAESEPAPEPEKK